MLNELTNRGGQSAHTHQFKRLGAGATKQEGGVSVLALWSYPASKQGRGLCSTGILGNRPYNSLRIAAFPAPALWIALN
jgi:hypothetical protein